MLFMKDSDSTLMLKKKVKGQIKLVQGRSLEAVEIINRRIVSMT